MKTYYLIIIGSFFDCGNSHIWPFSETINVLNMLYKENQLMVCVFVTENSTLEKQDTFVEKLVTQIIKNLQVQISNVHVRYEDNVSTVLLKNFNM